MAELKEKYNYPPRRLLHPAEKSKSDEERAQYLLARLSEHYILADLMGIVHRPSCTEYHLLLYSAEIASCLKQFEDRIARYLDAESVKIITVPDERLVGIQVPVDVKHKEPVYLREILESEEMSSNPSPLLVALGRNASGTPVAMDIASMPHVLIAGDEKMSSDVSVCINAILCSILMRSSPQEVRLILIDPKVVELSVYNGIPHLLMPPVTDLNKALAALSWARQEIDRRYKRFLALSVRNMDQYNDAIGSDAEKMSRIVIIINELAGLMFGDRDEVEASICRLAQVGRAAGIHLIIASQNHPSAFITGIIRANIPSRIAFAVSSQIDSRTILDAGGAEKLLGKGDMLYDPKGTGKPVRVQGCFVSDDEVQRIVSFVRGDHEAEYSEDVIEQLNTVAQEDKAAAGEELSGEEPMDELLDRAIKLTVADGQVSISRLQRWLRVGYVRAGRLMDMMERRGIVSKVEGPTKLRTVLISHEEWRRMQENQE